MWTIEEMKVRGKDAFKKNYWPSVIVAIILSLLTNGTFVAANNSGSATVTTTNGSLESIPPETMAIIATAIVGAVLVVCVASLLLKIFLFNPLETGCYRFFKKNVENPPAPLSLIGESFNDYGRVFITMLLRDVFTALWTLLLIVPGIMKAYSYRMVPFIVKDNPELTPQEVLALSTKMMDGNRWQSFKMDFSFIGWLLLGILTLNIVNVFWTFPYMHNTNAALYLKLKEQV